MSWPNNKMNLLTIRQCMFSIFLVFWLIYLILTFYGACRRGHTHMPHLGTLWCKENSHFPSRTFYWMCAGSICHIVATICYTTRSQRTDGEAGIHFKVSWRAWIIIWIDFLIKYLKGPRSEYKHPHGSFTAWIHSSTWFLKQYDILSVLLDSWIPWAFQVKWL